MVWTQKQTHTCHIRCPLKMCTVVFTNIFSAAISAASATVAPEINLVRAASDASINSDSTTCGPAPETPME